MTTRTKGRRQTNRRAVAQTVIRALLLSERDGTLEITDIGLIVGRILRLWPYYSDRQRADTEREWLSVLRAECAAREVGRALDSHRTRAGGG